MPIFRINDKLHYFAHVPKCGGTSVDAYLTARFGSLGLSEGPRPAKIAAADRWSRSSAAHIPVTALFRFWPRDWLLSSFAVVRHPVRRLISVYFYARDVTRTVPQGMDFDGWCQEVLPGIADDPYRFDGHLLPQVAFIPKDSAIFRLEDGLDPVIPYLDGLVGTSDGPRQIGAENVGGWRASETAPTPLPETLALIASVYAQDFAAFGYPPVATATDASALPDLPVLAGTGLPPAPERRPLLDRLYRKLLDKADGK
jgi:hypothetical protein